EDGIRDVHVTGVQTCALPISRLLLAGGRRAALGRGGAAARLLVDGGRRARHFGALGRIGLLRVLRHCARGDDLRFPGGDRSGLGGRGVLLHHEYPADADRDDQASSGGEPRQFALGRGGVVNVEVAGSEAAALERRAVVGREGAATRAG